MTKIKKQTNSERLQSKKQPNKNEAETKVEAANDK